MPFVAGNDIQAFCTTCKGDRGHTVIEAHDGLVLRVRCMQCKEEHQYKRPHGPPPPEKKAARAPRQRDRAPRRPAARASTPGPAAEWLDKVFGKDPDVFRVYSMKDSYAVSDLVSHPRFGLGVVAALRGGDKVEVLFREGARTLVHNKK
jgi:hypothetical protein